MQFLLIKYLAKKNNLKRNRCNTSDFGLVLEAALKILQQ